MNSTNKPKPIQIRLPQELEDSLRVVASKTQRTLNSVVIDCLQENLPAVHPLEQSTLNFVSPFLMSKSALHGCALDRLNRYEAAVQSELDVLLQVAGILNAQASLARQMQNSLVKGIVVRVPEDASGELPSIPSREGTVSVELLAYIEASRVVKNIQMLKAGRKQASRYQYDAVSEWEAVKVLLKRLADVETTGGMEG